MSIYCKVSSAHHGCIYLIESFCNIINVFTVTFDQLNGSLLNKSINLFTDPKLLTVSV